MRLLLYLLVAINLFGVAIGLIFYSAQLKAAHPLFWVFIPDCPFYVLLASLFYLGVLKDGLLKTITALGMVKYGIWTIFVLLYYADYFLDFVGIFLLLEHIGMTAQIALLPFKIEKKHLLAATGWFLLNDFVDYALGHHPFLPSQELSVVILFTVSLSLAVPAFAYFIWPKLEKMWIIRIGRGLFGIIS